MNLFPPHRELTSDMSWVVFFDGDCAFCSASVRRLAAIDSAGKFAFAPLQGELAKRQGFRKFSDLEAGSMVLLRESDGRVFMRSDSLIEIARVLGGFWRYLTLLRLIPRRWRDRIYRLIARNRHRLASGRTFCSMPDPAILQRLRE
ncbi:DUF393 domain-containing protein [Luteolibacter pohnpeiensis]|uniref:DUF393 domain-containing protein n=1 Tax=Luteolibacter pohnpeiensis TaxID=454153 RepID=A0A934S4I2_9BACT|nr:DCC1-like thiol-disulfide oxidoreductase family protein [Luteolibacter pohnpeiensis]MBK1883000.1 DUF393 domain-containing protein [Luteolibacter pohnpeiensis]